MVPNSDDLLRSNHAVISFIAYLFHSRMKVMFNLGPFISIETKRNIVRVQRFIKLEGFITWLPDNISV